MRAARLARSPTIGLPPSLSAQVLAQKIAWIARASASGASVYFHCRTGIPDFTNRSRKPYLPPDLNSSQHGCGMVSHTDSCGPRWNVFMYEGRVVPSPRWPKPYQLSTSMIQCIPYTGAPRPYVAASSSPIGSRPVGTLPVSCDGYAAGVSPSGAYVAGLRSVYDMFVG